MGAILSLRELRHVRGSRQVLEIDALQLEAGERLAVLGPNGAGKTTLLRLIAGLEKPTEGAVEVDGRSMADADAIRRSRVAYVTQRAALLSTSVRRNVELALRWRGVERAERRTAASAALQRLGAAHLADRRALSLSGGEAQRVSLARALALDPRLLLLDEPAAGLDASGRQGFLDDLEQALADRAITVIHVSHRVDEALHVADRVAVLTDGVLRQLADPQTLLCQPTDVTVARLVGYQNVIAVEIRENGDVLIEGAPCLRLDAAPGPAELAAWASAIRIRPEGNAGLPVTVQSLHAGPGRWEVRLAGSVALRAHLPLHEPPPRPGDRVAVEIDPTGATLIEASDSTTN